MKLSEGSHDKLCKVDEDVVLQRAIQWYQDKSEGWELIYQTRPITKKPGAIGGVDAILFSERLARFSFIDAKGTSVGKEAKSKAFTNALGALIKRIRFENGYGGVEASALYVSSQWRARVKSEARHRRSEYMLALTPDYVATVNSALDPALAALLHLRVLIVSPHHVKEHLFH